MMPLAASDGSTGAPQALPPSVEGVETETFRYRDDIDMNAFALRGRCCAGRGLPRGAPLILALVLLASLGLAGDEAGLRAWGLDASVLPSFGFLRMDQYRIYPKCALRWGFVGEDDGPVSGDPPR
jgi:hypothetical protein